MNGQSSFVSPVLTVHWLLGYYISCILQYVHPFSPLIIFKWRSWSWEDICVAPKSLIGLFWQKEPDEWNSSAVLQASY